MMTIKAKIAVYEEDIAWDYKNEVIDTGFFYPFEEYVKDALYEDFLCDSEVEIPEEEIEKVLKKVKKELDILLQN